MKIKINGDKYHLYKDNVGPYDYYYHKGNFYEEMPAHMKVSKTFDMFGDHIATVKRAIPVQLYLWIIIPFTVAAIIFSFVLLQPKTEDCIVYKPHDFYVTNDNQLCLEILNKNSDHLYIIVGNITYDVHPGAFIDYVPYSGEKVVIIKYKDAIYTEVIA